MPLYVCPICASEHAYWDDSQACFKVCVAQLEEQVEHSRNTKLDVPELLCACDRAAQARRGVVQHRSGYWFIGKWVRWPDRGKASMHIDRTERSYGVEHHLIVYCPFCGRLLPRKYDTGEPRS